MTTEQARRQTQGRRCQKKMVRWRSYKVAHGGYIVRYAGARQERKSEKKPISSTFRVSLMYDETNNPTNDGAKMIGGKFSNLSLYNGSKYVDWGIYTSLIEYAWIVDYPYGSFTDKSITANSEIFCQKRSLSTPPFLGRKKETLKT